MEIHWKDEGTFPKCRLRIQHSNSVCLHLQIISTAGGTFTHFQHCHREHWYPFKWNPTNQGVFWSWIATSSKILWICYQESPLNLSPNAHCLAYHSSCWGGFCSHVLFEMRRRVAALESHRASSGPHTLGQVPYSDFCSRSSPPHRPASDPGAQKRQKVSFKKKKLKGSIVIVCGSHS